MRNLTLRAVFISAFLLLFSFGPAALSAGEDSSMDKFSCGLPLKDEELKKVLTPEQYRIMRENGTEVPFRNAYWDNKRQGIYVDAITGEPLFSSTDKFDSGTGWPSFTKPIEKTGVTEKTDASHGISRTEVRSRSSDSHLGHVFADGPQPAGTRYCLNSASLRFIPLEEMEKNGYGNLLYLFGKSRATPKTATAAFGAGCFWGVEDAFHRLKGVVNTTVGFMGGKTKNPTYREVCANTTGHAEAVLVEYDPAQVPYEQLLAAFWEMHDPTTPNRQGLDIGSQYRSVIFYYTSEQEKAARLAGEKLSASGKFKNPLITEIVPAAEFYQAEEYHQRYYEKQGIKPSCRVP